MATRTSSSLLRTRSQAPGSSLSKFPAIVVASTESETIDKHGILCLVTTFVYDSYALDMIRVYQYVFIPDVDHVSMEKSCQWANERRFDNSVISIMFTIAVVACYDVTARTLRLCLIVANAKIPQPKQAY